MASYTENILLTLRDHTDPVEVDSFNRDNEIIDRLLAPVAVDYAVLSSAARINSYNTMKAIRAASYAGIAVPEKNAMFFGDFDSEAFDTSEGALHCAENHGYLFSANGDTVVEYGSAGDVSSGVHNGNTFSMTAPFSGYIKSIELDGRASSSTTDIYISSLVIGEESTYRIEFSDVPTTRTALTYTFASPVYVHKGDTISGRIHTWNVDYYAYLYGAEANKPYIKFHCVPASQSGWIQTELSPLGKMGHSEARVYIQCLKDENGVVEATLIDENGDEAELEQISSRTTVTKDGNTCIELGFTVPFDKEAAALKINANANAGYVDVYNYAVTVL